MPKVSQLIEDLKQFYNPDDVIAYDIWSAEDVHHVNDDLTDAQADRVLELMHDKKGAEWGMNWNYLSDTMINMALEQEETS